MVLGRRGVIGDAALYVGMIFAIAIVFVVAFLIFDGISDGIADSDEIAQEHKDFISGQKDRFPLVMDATLAVLMVSTLVGVLLLSFFLQSNPGFFFVLLVIVVILAGVAGALSNAWQTMSEDGGPLGTSITNFPITNFILDNYMVFIVVQVMLMVLVFFAKPGGGL